MVTSHKYTKLVQSCINPITYKDVFLYLVPTKINFDIIYLYPNPTTFDNIDMSKYRIRGILYSGGGVLSPKSYVDVPAGPRKSDYLYTNFCQISHPSVYHFRKKSTQFQWIKLGAFYNNLPKIS